MKECHDVESCGAKKMQKYYTKLSEAKKRFRQKQTKFWFTSTLLRNNSTNLFYLPHSKLKLVAYDNLHLLPGSWSLT